MDTYEELTTEHALKRMKQRNIDAKDTHIVIMFGLEKRQGGANYHTLRAKDLITKDNFIKYGHLVGTVVITNDYGRVITVYRTNKIKKNFKHINKLAA